MQSYYQQFPPIWPGYDTGLYVGSGSYGDVWELVDLKHQDLCAEVVKEVRIPPASSGGLDEAKLQGLDFAGAKIYFEEMKQRALDEVAIMQMLSACPGIVHISDCAVRELDEAAGEVGWVIFIRMERLISFKDKLIRDGITVRELIKLGIDLSLALEACEEKGILHRDIKPENLFYAPETGLFKLGDFGVSCFLSRPTQEKGLPGTLTYMSPQIFRGGSSTPADDLYALAMVIYKLLNDNRVPFLPPYPQPFTPAQRDEALRIRLRGAKVPLPSALSAAGEHLTLKIEKGSEPALKRLAETAVKAVDPAPEARFSSAASFREALTAILSFTEEGS